MHQCTFKLNNEPMSAFCVGASSFPAFSGLEPHVNLRASACVPDLGPIPLGSYYIIDRQSGGRLGWLYDMVGDKEDWFGLYAADKRIDDWTYCNEVRRGNFRLHPKVGRGISRGCITINRPTDFHVIRHLLRASKKMQIPGTQLFAYGKVAVK